MSENVVVNVTWHSNPDACRKCLVMNGHTFLNVNIFDSFLIHEVYGEVWNFDQNVSRAHPHCRCSLEFTFECHLAGLGEEWGKVKSGL